MAKPQSPLGIRQRYAEGAIDRKVAETLLRSHGWEHVQIDRLLAPAQSLRDEREREARLVQLRTGTAGRR